MEMMTRLKEASPEIEKRKTFQREKWFYERSAYPSATIPIANRFRASIEKQALKRLLPKEGNVNPLLAHKPWSLVRPAPGQHSTWGYVSARITAIAIAFRIHSTDIISLNVYNTPGMRVARLLRNEFFEPGTYIEFLDASSLESGIYLYTINTSQQVVSK